MQSTNWVDGYYYFSADLIQPLVEYKFDEYLNSSIDYG